MIGAFRYLLHKKEKNRNEIYTVALDHISVVRFLAAHSYQWDEHNTINAID